MFIRNEKTKHSGFSLIEVLMATFVFAVIMIGVSGAFSSSFFSYKNTKAVQNDLEQAEYAMNLMAKTIRTSSVIIPASSSNVATIVIYDYSQTKCIAYQFVGSSLNSASTVMADKSTCISLASAGTLSNMIGNVTNVSFSVTPSALGTIGRVTISMEVGSVKDKARLQTTVSLRDYSVSGI